VVECLDSLSTALPKVEVGEQTLAKLVEELELILEVLEEKAEDEGLPPLLEGRGLRALLGLLLFNDLYLVAPAHPEVLYALH